MRKLIAILFIVLLSNHFAAAQTQSRRTLKTRQTVAVAAMNPEVERIFQKFAEAQGDPRAIGRVHSMVMRGTVEAPQFGLSGTIEIYAKDPNKKLTVLNLSGSLGQRLEARNGKQGWGQKPSVAAYDVSNDNSSDETDGNRINGLVGRSHFSKLTLKGKTIVDNREAYVIVGTISGNPTRTLYFDVENGLLVRLDVAKSSSDPESGAVSTFYDGFAKVNGVVMPTIIREVSKELTIITRFYEVKFNVHIEDSLFERPKGPNPDGKEEKFEKASSE